MTASVRGAGSCDPFREARMLGTSLRCRFGGGVPSDSGVQQVDVASDEVSEIDSGQVNGFFRAISSDNSRSDLSFSIFNCASART